MGGCSARAVKIMRRRKFPLLHAVGRGSWRCLSSTSHLIICSHFQKLIVSLIICNSYDEIIRSAEGVFVVRKQFWMLLSNHAWHDYFGGLAAFRIFRETGDECKFAVQVYVDQGLLWNVQHQTQLLEAEQSYSCGNILDAQTSYMNAITSARTQVL
jgi:hypothetical protein